MSFFQTSDGRLHAGRIAGVLYILGLLLGIKNMLAGEPMWLFRLASTVGWWMTFCTKRSAPTVREALGPLGIIGSILILIGIIGQLLFLGRQ